MTMRSTIQRSLVLEAVKELRCHVTADEVYDAVVTKHPDISKGTVYRNLKLLSDMGEIRKMGMPSGADRYDHLCHDHYHARCEKCGQIFDLDMEFMADLEKSTKDTRGFEFPDMWNSTAAIRNMTMKSTRLAAVFWNTIQNCGIMSLPETPYLPIQNISVRKRPKKLL